MSNSCLKNGAQKQKFPIWKRRLTSSYAIPPVTLCAQSGHHLHRHLHVSCADRTFSPAAGLSVCRACNVNLPPSVSPVLNETSPCQEIPPATFWHCNPYSALKLSSVFRPLLFTSTKRITKKCNQHYVIIHNTSCSKYANRYFPYWKILFLSSIFLKLLLRNHEVDFVEICNVCVRKAIIVAAKRIINSDKVCHSQCWGSYL